MKVLDLNLLLYAINRDSPEHARARPWLESLLSDPGAVGLPWVVILGFLRVATNPRVFRNPLSVTDAIQVAEGWLSRPNVLVLIPREGHWRILVNLLRGSGTAGNLTTDAHLAALCIEYGAELCSADSDFRRFEGLRWHNPLRDPGTTRES